jgi:alpha-1,6-mannosyltransferase
MLVLLATYAMAIVALLALYDRVVTWCQTGLKSPLARWLVLLLPVAFYVGYLPTTPQLSMDVYSYVAFGYVGVLPGGNPYLQEGGTVIDTAFGRQLAALGWPGSALSPYGPVWNNLESAIVRLTPDAAQAVVLSKALVVAASLGSALLVYMTVGRVRPDDRTAATAALLWNPLLVVLVAGEGHNDGFVMFAVLAALALTVVRQVTGGILVQLVAVLTKYLPVVLLPVQLAYWWRTELDRSRLAFELGLGGLLGVGLAVLLYQPVWVGLGTFMGTGALGSGGEEKPLDPLDSLVLVARYAAVAGAVLIGAWHARDTERFLQSCAGVLLIVVLLGPQKFWPWYAVTPVALMALTPGTFRWTMLVLSACALLAAPVEALPLYPTGLIRPELQAVVFHAARALPVLTLLGVWTVRAWCQRRARPTRPRLPPELVGGGR